MIRSLVGVADFPFAFDRLLEPVPEFIFRFDFMLGVYREDPKFVPIAKTEVSNR